MIDTSSLPVDGWVGEWASYGMSVVGAVVAFIRDHGPVADDRVLTVIRSTGFGADIRKASPTFDDRDGERRVLNLLVSDVDVITRNSDGMLVVPPETTAVMSAAKGLIVVPTADARAADRANARHKEHLRRWVFKSPFATDWRDGIRRWTDEDVFAMAERISAIGYCGPAIVCDQNGVVIDGHLRADALRLLDIDPDVHTEVRHFDNDLHRLAYVIAVHQRGKSFPTDLRNAIVSYVNSAAARSGEKVAWPADIPTIVGTGHGSPPLVGVSAPPSPVKAVAAPTEAPTEAPPVTDKPIQLSTRQRQVARLLSRYSEPQTADALGAVMGLPRDHVSPRLAEMEAKGLAVVVGRQGNQTWALTPRCVELLDTMWRPPTKADRPGTRLRDGGGPRPTIAGRLIQASHYAGAERWINRSALTGGSAKVDYVLRRAGWFVMDGAWLVIPDVLAEDWSKARVRRLTAIEVGALQAALIRGEGDFWDEWERLVRAELTE